MLKQKTFNYITFILAIITIFMVISASKNNTSIVPCAIMLFVTLVFSYISKKYNEEMLNLNKNDKEILDKLTKEKIEKKKVNR